MAEYWNRRYESGRDSGVGSSGPAAESKAAYVNAALAEHGIETVLDVGCGDGQQLDLLKVSDAGYVGTDVSKQAIELCRSRHPGKRFYLRRRLPRDLRADATLSLDTMFHQVNDDDYLAHLSDIFGRATRLVIIHSTNYEDNRPATHVRHRWFTPIVARAFGAWELIDSGRGFRHGHDQTFYTYKRRED